MLDSFYLTLLIGPTVPLPAPRPVVEALTSAQVTVSSGQQSGFQLTFGLSKKSLLQNVLLPAGYFDPTMRVILMVTVKGIPYVLMDGVITQQQLTPSNEPGQSTLTVTGEDLTRMMDLVDLTGTPMPAMPAEARVSLILSRYAMFGIVPLVIPSMLPEVPNPMEQIPSQHGTDLAYIQELAEDVGYVFYLQAGPAPGMNLAYWGPEVKVGLPQPALTVNLDSATNVESLSFSYDGFSKALYILRIQLPEDPPVAIPIPLPDIGPLNPPLGLKPIPPLRTETLDTAPNTAIQAAARGMARASQSADAISGSGQLDVLRYGRVLQARQLVSVRGVGLTYDGFYFVKSVTHNIKQGEYKQSFSLTRNAQVAFAPVVIP